MTDFSSSEGEQASATEESSAPLPQPVVNILIVDDEPRNLTVLEAILNVPGYRLIRAQSPEQALLALVAEDLHHRLAATVHGFRCR